MDFPGGSMVRNLPSNAGDMGLIPRSRRSPAGGNNYPQQYSCLGNVWIEKPGGLQFMGLQKESDMT